MSYTIQAPSQLSSHLRALRKAKGLTQRDLGKRLGLSQARVARIEGDPLSISVEQLLRVLAALGVRVDLDLMPTKTIEGTRNVALLDSNAAAAAAGTAGTPSTTTAPSQDEVWFWNENTW
jgi:HTH-type transcriptional regulator / antitoxin HipB